MAYDDYEDSNQGYVEEPEQEDYTPPEADFDDSAQGSTYTPPQDEAVPDESEPEAPPSGEQDWGIPDEYTENPEQAPMPEEAPAPEETEAEDDGRSWVRDLVDYTRSLFGIEEEAIEGGSPGGLPQQAPGGEEDEEEKARRERPIGASEPPPPEEEKASFDRKTGTAGGVRTANTREPTQYDEAGSKPFQREPGQAMADQTDALKAVRDKFFGEETPAQRDESAKLNDYVNYVMGKGEMPNEQRLQREAQAAANMPQDAGTTKSDIREAALKQAYNESPNTGAAMLQNFRVNQQNYRGIAAVSLDKGDRDTAAKLFNEGHTFVPDSAHAVVSPTNNGFMATVRDSKTGGTQATMLTDDQMRELLHKSPGEFDHLTDRGLQNMLQDVSRSPGIPAQQQQPGAQAQDAGNAQAMAPTSGVSNMPAGASVPQQVGPTAAPPGAMPGAAPISNLPPGAAIPQTGVAGPAGAPPAPMPPANPMAPAAGARPGFTAPTAGAARPAAPGGTAAPRNDMAGVRVMPDGSRQPLPPGADITKMRPPPGGFLSKGPGYATQMGGDPTRQGAQAPAGPPKNPLQAATQIGGPRAQAPQQGGPQDTGKMRGPQDPASKYRGFSKPGDVITGASNRAQQGYLDIDKPLPGTSKYGRDVRDKDGWPSGIPRGGAFSKMSYDAGGHTYDLDKQGMPLAQRGQPGWHGPQQGERGWNGTPGQYTDRSPFLGGPGSLPRTNAVSGAGGRPISSGGGGGRSDPERNAIQRDKLALDREKLDLRRELGGRGSDLKERDLSRKENQGNQRIDQSGQRLQQGDRRLDQGDRRANDLVERHGQQMIERQLDRIQKMDANQLNNAIRTIDSKMKDVGYDGLKDEEKALRDLTAGRAKSTLERQSAPSGGGSAPSGGQQSAPATAPAGRDPNYEYRTNPQTGQVERRRRAQ